MTHTINGADVHTPRAATDAMTATAAVYADLLASIEQSRANLTNAGVAGPAIDMLTAMFSAAEVIAAASQDAATAFQRHQQVAADTIGSDPSLSGTQSGRYLDPADL